MTIGFDAKRLFCNFTGRGNQSRTTVDLHCTSYPDLQMVLYTPRMVVNDITAPYTRRQQCRVVTPHGTMGGSLWRTLSLAGLAQSDGVDVFHGLSNELPTGLRRKGVRSVVTIHDVAFRTFPDMYRAHDRMVYDLKWRHACRVADVIIAISECTKRDIVKFYGVSEARIRVVYQPVGLEYYGQPLEPTPAAEPYMLYVGSVNSRKNLMGVVQAMNLLPADQRMRLVVVGNGGAYKREVAEYIERSGLSHLVEWRQAVDVSTLRRLYTDAAMMVYPSFYEGFGLPVVEASLCQCPVITSNVSSLPEAGGPHALTVDPEKPEEIAQMMQTLITDENLRRQTGIQARHYAMQAFHPQTLAHQLMAVYESCL